MAHRQHIYICIVTEVESAVLLCGMVLCELHPLVFLRMCVSSLFDTAPDTSYSCPLFVAFIVLHRFYYAHMRTNKNKQKLNAEFVTTRADCDSDGINLCYTNLQGRTFSNGNVLTDNFQYVSSNWYPDNNPIDPDDVILL